MISYCGQDKNEEKEIRPGMCCKVTWNNIILVPVMVKTKYARENDDRMPLDDERFIESVCSFYFNRNKFCTK